ncbi:hypothetical protein [Enterobacter cloacae complex sp. 289A7]|uniref:hypothetical protein n=1 Tax=Enterobacter cloacae complex sp. 289A7 TaxID=3395850 RepID=UPI003CF72DC4
MRITFRIYHLDLYLSVFRDIPEMTASVQLGQKKEQDFEALLRTAFLLGIDHNLILSKRNNKQELDQVSQSLKNWQDDDILKDMFRAGSQPKVRYEWLERGIPRLQDELNTFQVHEQYRAIEEVNKQFNYKITRS